jgi:hypothetical protein
MRPGRLPEDHPEEQEARAKLRQLSPEAQEAIQKQLGTSQEDRSSLTQPRREPKTKPRRWGS